MNRRGAEAQSPYLRVAEYSRHRISESQPGLVVAAVQDVVKAARGPR